jgi:phosphate uptake regulator
MFETLKALLTGTDLIKKAYEETFAMLDVVERLYGEATGLLLDGRQPAEDIHKEDKAINKTEMAIRHDVLAHLSMSPQTEVAASLILSAVVGYVERVGDYTKNIVELAGYCGKPLRGNASVSGLVEISGMVGENIAKTRKAFAEEDKDLAGEVIADHKKVRAVCDEALDTAFASETMSKDDALASATYARYLKRISAGLKNVCTAVTAPYDHIGYSKPAAPDA